jgi:putative thioredoxin
MITIIMHKFIKKRLLMSQQNLQHAVALTVENFKQVIIDASQDKLVITFFWAPWDEASVQMLSTLDAIVAQNAQALALASVNSDEQPQIVQQFGVRSLPTTIMIKAGQPVDGAEGAQTSEQIQQILTKHLPSPEQEVIDKALAAAQSGDMHQAFTLSKQAFDINPDNIESRLLLSDCAVETGQLATAKTLMGAVKLADQDSRYQSIMGKIELAEKAAESPELLVLQEQLANNPDDFDLKIKLALQLQQAHKTEQGLDLLFEVILKDLNYADAKKITLDMINSLPDGEPLKSKYRRKIYSLLY